jgi:hypothetical protein
MEHAGYLQAPGLVGGSEQRIRVSGTALAILSPGQIERRESCQFIIYYRRKLPIHFLLIISTCLQQQAGSHQGQVRDLNEFPATLKLITGVDSSTTGPSAPVANKPNTDREPSFPWPIYKYI